MDYKAKPLSQIVGADYVNTLRSIWMALFAVCLVPPWDQARDALQGLHGEEVLVVIQTLVLAQFMSRWLVGNWHYPSLVIEYSTVVFGRVGKERFSRCLRARKPRDICLLFLHASSLFLMGCSLGSSQFWIFVVGLLLSDAFLWLFDSSSRPVWLNVALAGQRTPPDHGILSIRVRHVEHCVFREWTSTNVLCAMAIVAIDTLGRFAGCPSVCVSSCCALVCVFNAANDVLKTRIGMPQTAH